VGEPASSLGRALFAAGRAGEAEKALRRARGIQEKRLGPRHPQLAVTLHALADVLAARGRTHEARTLYERALAIRLASLPAGHPAVAAARGALQGLTGRS
jgi:tetratricopeptide (TPR) repeat protein